MLLPLFECTDEVPSQGSFFLEISPLVFACSADSLKLLKRLDESPFKTISMQGKTASGMQIQIATAFESSGQVGSCFYVVRKESYEHNFLF